MTKHPAFDVFRLEWLAEQGILLKINHPQCQIIAGAPKCMRCAGLFLAERLSFDRRSRDSVRTQITLQRFLGDYHKSSET
jgi:hypothetical protein